MSLFHKKLLIELGVMFGVLIILGGLLFFLGNKVNSYVENISKFKIELANWGESVQFFVAMRTQYNEKTKEYISTLENIIPEKDKLIDLKKDFQFLSGGNVGLNFSFSGERSANSPSLGAMGINLDLHGSLDDIVSFLRKLEDFQYLISIDSLNLSQKDNESSANLRGLVFFRK